MKKINEETSIKEMESVAGGSKGSSRSSSRSFSRSRSRSRSKIKDIGKGLKQLASTAGEVIKNNSGWLDQQMDFLKTLITGNQEEEDNNTL